MKTSSPLVPPADVFPATKPKLAWPPAFPTTQPPPVTNGRANESVRTVNERSLSLPENVAVKVLPLNDVATEESSAAAPRTPPASATIANAQMQPAIGRKRRSMPASPRRLLLARQRGRH